MSRLPDLESIAAGFAARRSSPEVDSPVLHKAAVAAILRQGPAGRGAELLFIRRSEHPRDPWSGHMGLPGGRVDPGDGTPFAAALRETREELGLDLARTARPLGRLSEVRTHLSGDALPKSVVPFGFALDSVPELVLNHEVQEAVWVPLGFLADPANRDTMSHVHRGTTLALPCYHFEGRVIWGLTLWIVDDLLALAGDAR